MVYITGDLHGDLARLSAPDMRQVKKGDTLIVCGDFGFIWNGDRREKKSSSGWGRCPTRCCSWMVGTRTTICWPRMRKANGMAGARR